MSDIATVESREVVVTDTTGANDMAVNADGSINVAGIVSNFPAATSISSFVNDGKVFTISDQISLATAGSDNLVFLIRNPSGSGKTLYLYRILFGINVVNVLARFKTKKNPTVTATGTAVTPVNNNIGNSNTSAMNVYKASTVSGGTQLTSITTGQNNSSFDFLGDFSVFLQPGNDLIITGDPASNNREASVTVVWAEV